MTTATPHRLAWALGLSLLAHTLVLALSVRPGFFTPAILAAFEPIEITLAAAPVLRTLTNSTVTNSPQAVLPVADTTPNASESAAADDTPIVEARADIAALNNPKPPYPLAARRQGVEGRVLLTVFVRTDGSCAEVKIRQSSGHVLLDNSALGTVRRWRFLPARRAGIAIDSWVEIPVSFRLNG